VALSDLDERRDKDGGRARAGLTRWLEDEVEGDGAWACGYRMEGVRYGGVPHGVRRVWGLAAGKTRTRRRRWPVGHLPHEAGERREEGGHVGHTWKIGAGRGEGQWAGPEETVKVLIYLNNFPTNLNCFDQKVDLPSSKIYK
jgi:hypothetical protein